MVPLTLRPFGNRNVEDATKETWWSAYFIDYRKIN